MLKEVFIQLILNYQQNNEIALSLWNEIEKNYNKSNRFYHGIQHLENLYAQLIEVKPKIKDWEATVFALFYHDVIYNVLKSNNEEKSALLAEKHLKELKIPEKTIQNCVMQILATKKHELSSNDDINYFTDADLSILGQDWKVYLVYFENVRKEYAIYPNFLYYPGRKKALMHFLEMNQIFKTEYFSTKFESNARLNIQKEIEMIEQKQF